MSPIAIACRIGDVTALKAVVARTLVKGTLTLAGLGIDILHPNIAQVLQDVRVLDLRDNKLQALPPSLADCPHIERALLDGNPMELVPSVFRSSWSKLKSYLATLNDRAASWACMRLLLVGEEATGKTTLVKCLVSRKVPNLDPSSSSSSWYSRTMLTNQSIMNQSMIVDWIGWHP